MPDDECKVRILLNVENLCDLLVIKIIHHPFVLNGLILEIKPDNKK